jgi:hypothetical protein
MKCFSILILTTLLFCNSNQEMKKHIDRPDTTEIANSKAPSDDIQNGDTLKTEIIETFVDSLKIGEKGKCKVELIKHRVYDDKFVIIKFYIKARHTTQDPETWMNTNIYSYETNAMTGFEPNISDFNNDNYNDITFISGTAARGANEVRRLFIYDNQMQELISIVNSQDYPNMLYNKELDCIDAFMVHGASTTVFAKISGDRLTTFATVQNSEYFHTINLVDENGNERELYKVKSKGVYVRHKNFKPLIEYEDEN